VGRFALRGVGSARHLYTLDPALLKNRQPLGSIEVETPAASES
jgi:hypothetical protein